MVDTSDIRALTAEDFAKARKNPFAEKIRKHDLSISVTEHYRPSDVADISNGLCSKFFKLDEDELAALEEYNKKNNR